MMGLDIKTSVDQLLGSANDQIDSLDKRISNLEASEVGGLSATSLKVKNTSGVAANVGDCGYITEAGEYKTTTTASLEGVAWCVVLTGGANNNDIYVIRRGRLSVNYTGTAPAAGNYLVTSAVAGLSQRQTTMHPAVFAVAMAAGSGGIVDALLLTNHIEIPITASVDMFAVANASDSDFVATINGAPAGSTLVYNAPTSGAEDAIKPTLTTLLFKQILYNTTRGTSALISDVDIATNTITLTAAVPAGWINGDTITTRSQTNTDTYSSVSKFYDLELLDTSTVPANTFSLLLVFHNTYDSTGVPATVVMHPFEAGVAAKRFQAKIAVAGTGTGTSTGEHTIALKQRRIQVAWDASGAGTLSTELRLHGYQIKAP